jgi:signal transduction histidine kinase
MDERRGQWGRRGRALDGALPLSAATVTALALYGATSSQDQTLAWDPGWLLAPLLGVVLLFRRRFPVGVLLASIAMVISYYATGRPAIGLELPLAPAFLSLAERGRLRSAAVIAGALVVSTYSLRVFLLGQAVPVLLGLQLVSTVVVLAGAIGLGDVIHSRERRQRAETERDRLLAVRREEEMEARIHREREQIARDVHDVLGHTMVVISMQADLALDAGRSDEVTQRALRTIRECARSALDEVRESLSIVARDGMDARAPVATVENLDELIDRVREAGLVVESSISGQPRAVPVTVGATAYRIAQESLTNILRHSGATRVKVCQEWAPERLILEISDDGSVGSVPEPGNGIQGMQERAAMIGGRATASYVRGCGFVVRADLPLPRPRGEAT